jgi:hypothetical protein
MRSQKRITQRGGEGKKESERKDSSINVQKMNGGVTSDIKMNMNIKKIENKQINTYVYI